MNERLRRALVLFAPGFEEVEGITPVDFLRRAGVEVLMVGVGHRVVAGNHNIRVHTDIVIDELPSDLAYDAVVLPGGMPGAANLSENPTVMELIERTYAADLLVAAICAAPGVVLGKTTILENRKFTCYPGYEQNVEAGHFCEDRVVLSDNVITSRGPGTAAEFAEAIISYLFDAATAGKLHTQTIQK
ncbi:MAG TPA: DJ-1 family glyoxalase III [Spirochaetia bacterium]|nr:DJ-1 family glyoxalase III [Spirochaetia bacterium]